MNDNTKNPVTGWLNTATGIKVTYDPLPADQPLNKLNAIMARGNKDRYAEYAIQGALFDIGAVFNNYPNIKATPQELLDMVKGSNSLRKNTPRGISSCATATW
jgi:hypothetical protein